MEDKLKPCPFCGKPARYIIEEDHHGGSFSLGCNPGINGLRDDCIGATLFYTANIEELAESIVAWNTRADERNSGVDEATIKKHIHNNINYEPERHSDNVNGIYNALRPYLTTQPQFDAEVLIGALEELQQVCVHGVDMFSVEQVYAIIRQHTTQPQAVKEPYTPRMTHADEALASLEPQDEAKKCNSCGLPTKDGLCQHYTTHNPQPQANREVVESEDILIQKYNTADMESLAVEHGLVDTPTFLAHRRRIESALRTISDDGFSDAGIGFGGMDFWIKMQGVEYHLDVKTSEERIKQNSLIAIVDVSDLQLAISVLSEFATIDKAADFESLTEKARAAIAALQPATAKE
jgi:hypothetical protein